MEYNQKISRIQSILETGRQSFGYRVDGMENLPSMMSISTLLWSMHQDVAARRERDLADAYLVKVRTQELRRRIALRRRQIAALASASPAARQVLRERGLA
jgi:hypothetical protein